MYDENKFYRYKLFDCPYKATFLKWNESVVHNEIENSALLTSSGTWIISDKYRTSNFACEMDPESAEVSEKFINEAICKFLYWF